MTWRKYPDEKPPVNKDLLIQTRLWGRLFWEIARFKGHNWQIRTHVDEYEFEFDEVPLDEAEEIIVKWTLIADEADDYLDVTTMSYNMLEHLLLEDYTFAIKDKLGEKYEPLITSLLSQLKPYFLSIPLDTIERSIKNYKERHNINS